MIEETLRQKEQSLAAEGMVKDHAERIEQAATKGAMLDEEAAKRKLARE